MSEIVSKGWNIHYQTMGDRNSPPLLMIPGYSHRIAHWGELPKMLSQRLFLILVDCRGMGQSEVRDEPYSLRDEAEDMCAVLASIDVPRAHVVGFSRGSFVAQELALTFPNSVLSLILGGSTHRGPDSVGASPGWSEATKYTPGQGLDDFYGNMIDFMGAQGWRERDPQAFHACLSVDLEAPPRRTALRRQQESMANWSSFDRLSTLRSPVLVLVAEEDRVMPPENSHQLGRLIPKATLVQIPQCGHLPMWEKPRAYADAMFQFLQL